MVLEENQPLAGALRIPKCIPGIGKLILAPDSAHLIEGVSIAPQTLWPDDRGCFQELLRVGQGIAASFNVATMQTSCALSYPETIKAFHYHQHQTDIWSPVLGMLQVALVDLRPDSPTFGLVNTIYSGVLRPWQIKIPPGVGHGYKVVSPEPAMLVYFTDRFYDAADEGRLAYNHEAIAYDWERQHK
jgi:dTDP-4-dehydrorhamnose 3,5-epimerase